jgi:hypothetical protein
MRIVPLLVGLRGNPKLPGIPSSGPSVEMAFGHLSAVGLSPANWGGAVEERVAVRWPSVPEGMRETKIENKALDRNRLEAHRCSRSDGFETFNQ